ncbi:hypothetical protein NZ698_01285 [Chryseobacterium sp. PBS4-4]|uniref:Uncharacterized protein n=1 Tax=Chryseobacterium edaphi TaxID=2976532 RepID=A0ABT2W0Q4_9FLAO|nr:hypothetical protein [Chryseobacterium edaphi]MCU7615817.1 hypothetical protein [Chryseobacterium edaphi]
MSSKETGHAKNIANLKLLHTHILEVENYNPSNSKLSPANLLSLYAAAFQAQEAVNTLSAPYSNAVNDRQAVFAPVSRLVTKLRKAYKATENVNQAELENFMSIARKIKGNQKKQKPIIETTAPGEEEYQHSSSQLSFDQRTNNLDLLISLLQNTPTYLPNEQEFTTASLQVLKQNMLDSTQQVADAFVPLNNARSKRNLTLYNAEDNLVDTANKAKDYLFTILDTSSPQYKAISKIKFKNR